MLYHTQSLLECIKHVIPVSCVIPHKSTLSLLNLSKHVPAYLPVAELSRAVEVGGREAEKDVREMEGVE